MREISIPTIPSLPAKTVSKPVERPVEQPASRYYGPPPMPYYYGPGYGGYYGYPPLPGYGPMPAHPGAAPVNAEEASEHASPKPARRAQVLDEDEPVPEKKPLRSKTPEEEAEDALVNQFKTLVHNNPKVQKVLGNGTFQEIEGAVNDPAKAKALLLKTLAQAGVGDSFRNLPRPARWAVNSAVAMLPKDIKSTVQGLISPQAS